MAGPDPLRPAPIGAHVESNEFHMAMRLAGTPPAVVKSPPAARALPRTPKSTPFSARTLLVMPPPKPGPIGCHTSLTSFHSAMRLTAVPPEAVNAPPTIVSFRNRSTASPPLWKPAPIGCHAGGGKPTMGSSVHREMKLAETPPAVVNSPPAINSLGATGPGYVNDLSAVTVAFMPVPSVEVSTPSYRAMFRAGVPPVVVCWKSPPAT